MAPTSLTGVAWLVPVSLELRAGNVQPADADGEAAGGGLGNPGLHPESQTDERLQRGGCGEAFPRPPGPRGRASGGRQSLVLVAQQVLVHDGLCPPFLPAE